MKGNIALGKAAEMRVASELLLRGYEVFLPSVDSGADLILGDGKKLQVKAARKTSTNKHRGYRDYVFTFKRWKRKVGSYEPHSLENVDYVILWAVEDDAFFIIPSNVIRGRFSVKLGLNKRNWSRYMPFKDKWETLK